LITSPLVRVERRVGQRFSFLLPLVVRDVATALECQGFTQDLSSRGVFFFTDAPLQEGAEVEITLRMPSEITLGESMPVRCRGRVLRVVKPAPSSLESVPATRAETKIGVAVRLDGYEYLPEPKEFSSGYARISALHHPEDQPDDDQPVLHASARH
jgi:PilZ domain-containing protein